MGLDQYAYRIKPPIEDIRDPEKTEELSYWRKHPNLHGWMEDLYIKRGGDKVFNCIPLQLFEEDLDKLEKDIKEGKLPHTRGFFFGNSMGDTEEKNHDLEFVKRAKESIDEGYFVYYDSWW